MRCFEAGALATGASLEVLLQGPTYSEFRHRRGDGGPLPGRTPETWARVFPPASERTMSGSTDMANVSLAIPSIHPMLGIDSLPAVNHQPEFTAAAASPAADRALLDGAVAMAWTTIDLARDPALRDRLGATAYQHSEPRLDDLPGSGDLGRRGRSCKIDGDDTVAARHAGTVLRSDEREPR